MDISIEQYKLQFYSECKELLENVTDDILKAESNSEDKELLNSIFRNVHTIKGSAGSFDLGEVSDFAHHLEGLLDSLREGEIEINADIVDAVLEGADTINKMISVYEKGEKPILNEDLIETFIRLRKKEQKIASATEQKNDKKDDGLSTVLPDDIPEAIRNQLKEYENKDNLNLFCVDVQYNDEVFACGFDPLIFIRNLEKECELFLIDTKISELPDFKSFDPLKLYFHPKIYIATKLSSEEVEDIAFDVSLVEVFSLGKNKDNAISKINEESLKEYIEVMTELLDSFERSLLQYEGNGSRDDLNEIFRIVHMVKSDCAFIGLMEISDFSHELESLLEQLRSNKQKKTDQIIEILFNALDFYKKTTQNLSQGNMQVEMPSFFQDIENLVAKNKKIQESDGFQLKDVTDDKSKVFLEQAFQYKDILKKNLMPLPLDDERKTMVQRILMNLKKAAKFVELKTLIFYIEEFESSLSGSDLKKIEEKSTAVIHYIESFDQQSPKLGEILISDGKITESDVAEILEKQKPIGALLVESGKADPTDIEEALIKQELIEISNQVKATSQRPKESKTMRVEEEKIEAFSNMVGELLVARNTYDYILNNFSKDSQGRFQDTIKEMNDNLRLFTRITNDIHHGILSLRMIPIKGIFHKFTRVVRDISRKQKKMIDLIMEGEETEIDKKVADVLSEPLVHIIRNSCDHGVESPLERKNAGKPEKASVILRAYQEGSDLIIKIIDDGRGINREKIFNKAVKMGMDVQSVDDENLLNVIFMPGFSTKEEVSDLSGRGVGMDVVNTAITKLNGDVNVISNEGEGTEITLNIPVTMGLKVSLLIQSNQKIYAIPLEYVMETIKIEKNKIRKHKNRMFFYNRGEVIPAEHIDYLLNGENEFDHKISNQMEIPVVILKTKMGKFGIIVDQLLKNMELAIKPVPNTLSDIKVVNGVSIMGDGKVVLILNPDEFLA